MRTKIDALYDLVHKMSGAGVKDDSIVEMIDQVTNAYSSGGGGGTSDYTDLENKPSINGVTLTGNKTTSDLGITASFDNVITLNTVPAGDEEEAVAITDEDDIDTLEAFNTYIVANPTSLPSYVRLGNYAYKSIIQISMNGNNTIQNILIEFQRESNMIVLLERNNGAWSYLLMMI